ncbi:MAG: alpha-amylase, partial [Clostridia bacterium]|nr:alpha-amylase [Clostridia bacterium]
FIEGLPTKEGGYIRTGARTPMQWCEGKNHGFSESDTPYLPTDAREGAPTVAAQEKDENSLLSFVKTLIKLHKDTPALWADASMKVVNAGYPFVFERTDGKDTLVIAINPSSKEYSVTLDGTTAMLSQNATQNGNALNMQGVSFFVGRKGN